MYKIEELMYQIKLQFNEKNVRKWCTDEVYSEWSKKVPNSQST